MHTFKYNHFVFALLVINNYLRIIQKKGHARANEELKKSATMMLLLTWMALYFLRNNLYVLACIVFLCDHAACIYDAMCSSSVLPADGKADFSFLNALFIYKMLHCVY